MRRLWGCWGKTRRPHVTVAMLTSPPSQVLQEVLLACWAGSLAAGACHGQASSLSLGLQKVLPEVTALWLCSGKASRAVTVHFK